MREGGIVIATAVDNRHMAVFVEAFKACHPGIKAKMFVDLAQSVRRNAQSGSAPVIGIVTIRHQCVQPIIASREF